jgi:hypothetical protein
MNAGNIIAVLFLSRDVAHREHLRTTSYAAHKALNEFYDSVVDIADELAETCQGRYGIIKDIPYLAPENVQDIVAQLEAHLYTVEKLRYKDLDKEDTAIQNIVDEVVGLYLTTLYKLRTFK